MHVSLSVPEHNTEGTVQASDDFIPATVLSAAIDSADPGSDYALAAAFTMEKLRAERGGQRIEVDMHFVSELRDTADRKYGLGSSAAITAAVIIAFDKLYEFDLSAEIRFKLGLLASLLVSKNTSGGDVAAATFGGWVRYVSPNRAGLPRVTDTDIATALASRAWQKLSISSLSVSDNFRLLIGWTGNPASTGSLVGQVRARSVADTATVTNYSAFIKYSAANVDALTTALVHDDWPTAARAIRTARTLLNELAGLSDTDIETDKLGQLVACAETYGAVAKSSGAGGGDCGIALAHGTIDTEAITDDWHTAGITVLDLSVDKAGAL